MIAGPAGAMVVPMSSSPEGDCMSSATATSWCVPLEEVTNAVNELRRNKECRKELKEIQYQKSSG
jgi:hypothetical protein